MEEYRLLTKDKESISSVKCDSYEEAVEYFAEMKKLPITVLMSIFEVEKFEESISGGSSRKQKR
jgi:hypothetical protein